METYTALNKSSQKRSYKAITIILGIILIVFGISSGEIPGIIFGAFFIYLTLYSKTVVVDAAGVTSLYNAVFFKRRIAYSFEEFQGVLEEVGDSPEMNVGFIRNGMTNYYLFTRSDGEAVIRLAKEANPKISVRKIKPRRKSFF